MIFLIFFKNLLWGTGEGDRTKEQEVDANVHNATASVSQNCKLSMFQNYKMNTSHLPVLLFFYYYYCFILVQKILIRLIHFFPVYFVQY